MFRLDGLNWRLSNDSYFGTWSGDGCRNDVLIDIWDQDLFIGNKVDVYNLLSEYKSFEEE